MRRTLRRAGFTAIEMIAVLVLASLSAALTIVSLTGLRNRSAMTEVIDHLALCDELARRFAIRLHQPVALVWDTDRGRISQCNVSSRNDSTAGHVFYEMPRNYQIREIVLHGGETVAGPTQIPISAQGYSATYAVQISDGRTTTWLIMSGLTGQLVQTQNEEQVYETLGELARPGDDPR